MTHLQIERSSFHSVRLVAEGVLYEDASLFQIGFHWLVFDSISCILDPDADLDGDTNLGSVARPAVVRGAALCGLKQSVVFIRFRRSSSARSTRLLQLQVVPVALACVLLHLFLAEVFPELLGPVAHNDQGGVD